MGGNRSEARRRHDRDHRQLRRQTGRDDADGAPLALGLVISTKNSTNGSDIEVDGQVFGILELQHVKPGKGQAFGRSKLRNVSTGAVTDKTFRAGEKVRAI